MKSKLTYRTVPYSPTFNIPFDDKTISADWISTSVLYHQQANNKKIFRKRC